MSEEQIQCARRTSNKRFSSAHSSSSQACLVLRRWNCAGVANAYVADQCKYRHCALCELWRLALLIPLEFTGEYSATARRAAVTHTRGGANLNCTSEILEIFSHPSTAYRQLNVCVQ
jgi:hypothetical protein